MAIHTLTLTEWDALIFSRTTEQGEPVEKDTILFIKFFFFSLIRLLLGIWVVDRDLYVRTVISFFLLRIRAHSFFSMASSPSAKAACSTCRNKNVGVFKCQGCSQIFCRKHSNEHRERLSHELDEVILGHDNLQQSIMERQGEETSSHPLIQQINQWKSDSIRKIQQEAEQAREQVLFWMSSQTSKSGLLNTSFGWKSKLFRKGISGITRSGSASATSSSEWWLYGNRSQCLDSSVRRFETRFHQYWCINYRWWGFRSSVDRKNRYSSINTSLASAWRFWRVTGKCFNRRERSCSCTLWFWEW